MSYSTPIDETPKPTTLLLKGPSGYGKTYKAAQFPRPVIFNFDNNLSGVMKLPPDIRKNIKIANPFEDAKGKKVKDVEVWQNFVNKLELAAADPEVETIVIDSLTTLSAILIDKILGTGDPAKRMEIQHWGDFSRYMKWLGEHLLCAPDLDKHVVILAHEVIKEDKQKGTIQYLLSIGGETKSNFDLYFTDVWRVWQRESKTTKLPEYWIRTLPNDYHTAKTALNVPPDFLWDTQKDDIFKQLAALKRK